MRKIHGSFAFGTSAQSATLIGGDWSESLIDLRPAEAYPRGGGVSRLVPVPAGPWRVRAIGSAQVSADHAGHAEHPSLHAPGSLLHPPDPGASKAAKWVSGSLRPPPESAR